MPRWIKTINIKPFIDETQPASVVAKNIRTKLANAISYPDLTLSLILDDFEEVQTVEDCDDVLNRLYDWADTNDIWLGL